MEWNSFEVLILAIVLQYKFPPKKIADSIVELYSITFLRESVFVYIYTSRSLGEGGRGTPRNFR